jgi:cytidine deaminase
MELPYSSVDGMRVDDIPQAICEEMLRKAEETRPNSYPLPNKVAAVVLTTHGNMYEGVSYHTEIMSLTMHAEATALAHAAIHGEKEIIAITGPNCHACKQLIGESSVNSGIATVVIMREGERILEVPISAMMQYGWPENPWRDADH